MLATLGAMTDGTADNGISIIIHVIVVIKVKFDLAVRAIRIISDFIISFSLGSIIV